MHLLTYCKSLEIQIDDIHTTTFVVKSFNTLEEATKAAANLINDNEVYYYNIYVTEVDYVNVRINDVWIKK